MKIILQTHSSDSEYNGDCDYAVVDLTPIVVQQIRQRAELARQARQRDDDLYELSFWGSPAEFYDSGLLDACDKALAAAAEESDADHAVRDWLADLEQNGHALLPAAVDLDTHEAPRVECGQVILRCHRFPEGLSLEVAWTAIPKHSDVGVTSASLPLAAMESYLRQARGGFGMTTPVLDNWIVDGPTTLYSYDDDLIYMLVRADTDDPDLQREVALVSAWDLEGERYAPMIAAVPKLLAACQAVVDRWEHGDLAEAVRMCGEAVEAALGPQDGMPAPGGGFHSAQRKTQMPKKTREIEYYRLWPGGSGDSGTWDTDFVEIPADTPEDEIAEAVEKAASKIQWRDQPPILTGVYSAPQPEEEDEAEEAEPMTHWKCPRCGHRADVPAYELAEIGTPFCANCQDGANVEMEPVLGETKARAV